MWRSLVLILCSGAGLLLTASEPRWQELHGVADVVAAYPERMQGLMEALDLDRPELAAVAEAHAAADLVGACRALLDHYRDSTRWSAHRRPALKPSTKTQPKGEDLLVDRLRFRQEIGIVPSTPAGRLRWFHTGPDKNKQFAKRLHRHLWAGDRAGAGAQATSRWPCSASCANMSVTIWRQV